MATEAQRRASAKYDKNHTRSVLLKFNTSSDADILARLDEVENKQGYIKGLVRRDIRGTGEILSINAISLMIQPVIRKYDLEQVSLFGSYARGDATKDSDLDFVVKCNGIRTMEQYTSLVEGFRKATGKNVDIVMADTLHSKQTRAAQRLAGHIEREKVVIYG